MPGDVRDRWPIGRGMAARQEVKQCAKVRGQRPHSQAAIYSVTFQPTPYASLMNAGPPLQSGWCVLLRPDSPVSKPTHGDNHDDTER